MTTFQSDFIGRVNRLALRPSEKGALLPLMEAVSNSIYSVTERFEGDTAQRGKITIILQRDESAAGRPIIGFSITDNGLGFTDQNFRSFITPDSRLKEQKGGKGIGRLGWVKVFRNISVQSVFADGDTLKKREFRFRLSEVDQVDDGPPVDAAGAERLTTITFTHFLPSFSTRCPSNMETIVSRVISHFVPLFVAGNAPKIIISDGDESKDVEATFGDSIVDQATVDEPVVLGPDTFALTVWSLKCKRSVKFDTSGYNFAFITGNNRSVIQYCLDDQLGLKKLDNEFIYIACASSDFLDRNVNEQRTSFNLEAGEIDEVKRGIIKAAKVFLAAYLEEGIRLKVGVISTLIAENPQFLYVAPTTRAFAEKLQPNATKKEDILVELSRDRFRRQNQILALEREIIRSEHIDEAMREKIDVYQSFVREQTKGALAEYVVKRKAVLDVFEKFLEYRDPERETYNREELLHKLICPMKVEQGQLELDDHNLWLVDDRLAFFNFFASDKRLSDYTGSESAERPDLAFFYDSCVAWRDREQCDTVVIVEFKKPMREDYSQGRDPVQQVLAYVKKLKEEPNVPDVHGRPIRGVGRDTSFHCYIIADLTPPLEERIIGRFHRTPDRQGFFGYSAEPQAFIEIIPYGKILADAKLRNAIFFQKLGITNAG